MEPAVDGFGSDSLCEVGYADSEGPMRKASRFWRMKVAGCQFVDAGGFGASTKTERRAVGFSYSLKNEAD
jgi:hypothetical protein